MPGEIHPDANLLGALIEGDLGVATRREVLDHLGRCDACRQWAACAQIAASRTGLEADALATPDPVRGWSGAWRFLPPTLAACVALAASGLWMRRAEMTASLAAPSQVISVPAAAPALKAARIGRTAASRAPLAPATARVAAGSSATPTEVATADAALVVPSPPAIGASTAAAALALPAEPEAPQGRFQPTVDFSPLTTGFQDQTPVRILRPQLLGWNPAADRNGPEAMAAAAAAGIGMRPVLAVAASAPPFTDDFSSASDRTAGALSGPFAPAAAVGLSWAISRGGELLHSIGAGLWQAVPLVPGLRVRALFASGAVLWAAGAANQLFVSHDRGAHWRQVPVPQTRPGEAVASIRFRDPRDGVLTLTDGAAWRTSDGGATWARQPAGR